MAKNKKQVKLFIYIVLLLLLLGGFVFILLRFHWLAIGFLVFLGVLFFVGVVIASKGKGYEEQIDSTLDSMVNFLVNINIGTYETVVSFINKFILFIKELYLNVIVPGVIFIFVMIISYLLLILLRYINVHYENGVTYFVLVLAFVSPLLINYLQYTLKSNQNDGTESVKNTSTEAKVSDLMQGQEIFNNAKSVSLRQKTYADRLKEKVSSMILSSIEIGLAFLFLFMDSTKAFFIPEDLRQVPLVSYLGKYDLTLRLYSPKQLDFAFTIVILSIVINFMKVFLEKAIYQFYVRNKYIEKDSSARTFRYTNLILTTLALHIIFLPFIRLKHLVLTVGFAANFVADIVAALKEKEVWIIKEEKPVDIVGQLNKYVVVPILKKIFRVLSFLTPI